MAVATDTQIKSLFERNAEGMLKNMAIHELALLASFYDVTVDNIEDVVVDYHVMSENEQGAELLVSAVPKDCVGRAVEALEKAGLEPLEAELESSAMVNSALAADISHIDDAQLLVHVGEHSTCVAVVAGAELREMRVIHIGAMSHLGAELAAVAAEDTKSEAADGEAAADQEADASTAPGAAARPSPSAMPAAASVRIGPAETALTRTSAGPHSMARHLVTWLTPAFAAQA